jgi:hypothetical protein
MKRAFKATHATVQVLTCVFTAQVSLVLAVGALRPEFGDVIKGDSRRYYLNCAGRLVM